MFYKIITQRRFQLLQMFHILSTIKEEEKMKTLWTYIDSKDWQAESKYRFTLTILGILFALAGLILWLIIRPWILSTLDWMLCFIGYPIVISWFVVVIYSFRHDFHSGPASN